jgi:LuxR family transcriptional regulator, maltose regulon positive regulatory protein
MDESSEPGTQLPGLNQLLATKLHIPSPSQSLVPRPRLLERLNQGMERKLILLSAPAGFGKTTLLCEWLRSPVAKDLPVAWISLDEGDNDPVRFGTYICAALAQVQAGVGERTLPLLHSPQPPSMETILTTLINEITAIPRHFVLVLDDYHVITAPSIHQTLTFLLDHLPEQMHVVLATRIDPPLPLSRLRVRGQKLALRAADLRFTPEEAAAFLREVMGLELSAEDIATLEARTEGWIAGLQLAALSLQGRSPAGIASFLSAFAGSHRFVFDYLAEEVLQRQEEHTQTFLLSTSLLDRLCGSLCDAVTQRANGQDMLEQLEQRNLFLIPLDDERHWYRYHHLFAEFLRSRLKAEQVHGTLGEPVEALHERASIWYERNQFLDRAIGHALSAHDFERTARLIEAFRASASEGGALVSLLRWFAALPDATIRSRPRLSLYYAQVLLLSGQFQAVNERLQDAEQSLVEHAEDLSTEERRIVQGEIDTIRAAFAYLHEDVAQGRKLAEAALRFLPPGHFLRGLLLLSLGSASWLEGDLLSASTLMTEAREVCQRTGNFYIYYVTTVYLAQVRLGQGQLREATRLYHEGLQVLASRGRQGREGNGLYVGLGALLYERNELAEAERLVQQGTLLGQQENNAFVIVAGKSTLARLRQAQGREQEAGDLMQQVMTLAQQNAIIWIWVPGPVDAAQVRLWLAQGNLAAAAAWAQERNTPGQRNRPLPPLYFQEIEEIFLARLALAQHRHAEALELLDRLQTEAQAAGRRGHVLEILLLKALTYQEQGNLAPALSALASALELAEPEAYIRTFVDEGPAMAALLRKIRATQGRATDYVERLLEAFEHGEAPLEPASSQDRQRTVPQPMPQPLIEPLSDREREVLELMATGASNQDIAEALVIAVNTVKRHARNIFDKLGVENRTQAVARARALGLL